MHTEILEQTQIELLLFLEKKFRKSFYLVGGTAIALYLGHRRSVDFNLFTFEPLKKYRIKQKLAEIPFKQVPIFDDSDQYHILINNVKTTFFHFPWNVPHKKMEDISFHIPDLLSLAAMKAFALGRQAKWKDYVDLFFLLRDHYSIEQITNQGIRIFGDHFSEKLFRQQPTFHKDIDYSESIDYLTSPVADNLIRTFLTEIAIKIY